MNKEVPPLQISLREFLLTKGCLPGRKPVWFSEGQGGLFKKGGI